jgi:arylsulfatase A-like enzyme
MMTGVHQIRTNTQNLRMNSSRELTDPYRAITHYFRTAGYYTAIGCGYSGKTDINFRPKEGAINGFDGRDWKNRNKDQPFFAQITLNITHRGNHWYADSPEIITNSLMDVYKAPYVYMPEFKNDVKSEDVVLPRIMPDHPIVRDDWARYLTQIQKMDVQVGQIIQRLKDEGVYENTMIIFISDNGVDHYRGEYWLYDRGIQIPMIIKWPDGYNQANDCQKCDDLKSAIDISATVLDIAGIDVPKHFDGISILDQQKKRKYIYAARDRIDSRVERIRCVRSSRYKYLRNYKEEIGWLETKWVMINNPSLEVIHNLYQSGNLDPVQSLHLKKKKPVEELYDLQEDPLELNNLAGSEMHSKILLEMSLALDAWIEDTGDTGQFPEKLEDSEETQWFNHREVYSTGE